METYIILAATCICATFLGLFTIIKACDWLISLKYKSISDCSNTRHAWENKIKNDFASKEAVDFLKEDMEEVKDKINDIHKIVMASKFQDKNDI